MPPPALPDDLPLAEVEAFSIDDVTTTEIDDALSVTRRPGGRLLVGIHIAAPALGITPGSAADLAARERLSTVYFPGGKITMLPDAEVAAYTLAAGAPRPALSHYLEVDAAGAIAGRTTRLERVTVAENLRHTALEDAVNETTLAAGRVDHRYADELTALWRLARSLEGVRRGPITEQEPRPDYSFYVADDRVRIVRRPRGTPVDKIVSELMIQVNSAWGRELAQNGAAAIYRVQAGGKVRMSTVPSGHEGLGVESYAWASSPLRRYVDLVNQRQLIALARGEAPPYAANDDSLLAAMRDFELAHDAYGEFQRQMERYWCLRWLVQENVHSVAAVVLRENLVRFEELPMVSRVPSAPALAPGTRVELALSDIDLIELTVRCDFRQVLPAVPSSAAATAAAGSNP
jgi:exoribonuclease-2